MKKYMGNKLAILLFVLPALAIFITFDFIPIIQVFAYSFTDWNGLTMPNFLGLQNYIDLFKDRVFATSNRNQLIFAIVITVYQMFFATVFAITISDKKMKGRKFLRVAYFIPVILSVTVVCQLWSAILSGEGLLNKLFEVAGSDFKQNWLGDRYKAIYVIAFVNAWQWMGYQFALIVAGIKSIPADYYEAARIDGCSEFRIFFSVVFPLSKPIVATVALMVGVIYWNDWQNALLYITSNTKKPLQLLLINIQKSIEFLLNNNNVPAAARAAMGGTIPQYSSTMATVIVVIGPIMVVYPFFQKYFVKGLTVGSVKG